MRQRSADFVHLIAYDGLRQDQAIWCVVGVRQVSWAVWWWSLELWDT